MRLARVLSSILGVGGLMVLVVTGSAMAQAPSPAKQSVAAGGVTVAVTRVEDGASGPVFHVVLDSHSANLDGYRFEEIVRLRDVAGGEVAPIAIEGTKGSGHHREAVVRFAWPDPKPTSLELVVKGVAGVPERAFRWLLE